MIPTSKDFKRHPFLGAVFMAAFLTVLSGSIIWGCMLVEQFIATPVPRSIRFSLEIDWSALLPSIIKFAAEVAVAAFTMFKMIKPIEARLDMIESRLDQMKTGVQLRHILEGRDGVCDEDSRIAKGRS